MTHALPEIEDLHQEACNQGLNTYRDPATGYSVFTKLSHLKRGWCCGNGCRHCPFGHLNVKDPQRRTNRIEEPVFIQITEEGTTSPLRKPSQSVSQVPVWKDGVVVFFSGGKDSYLAVQRKKQQLASEGNAARIILLTTFDPATGLLPQQQLPLRDVIVPQARRLRLDVLAVPLDLTSSDPVPYSEDFTFMASPPDRYALHIYHALRVLHGRCFINVKALVFGDLHLHDIRQWRETRLVFPPPFEELPLEFPLWQVPYSELETELEASGAKVFICAVGPNCPEEAKNRIRFGASYDQTSRTALRQEYPAVDAFGERGEFHTVVVLPGMSAGQTLQTLAAVLGHTDFVLPPATGNSEPSSPADPLPPAPIVDLPDHLQK